MSKFKNNQEFFEFSKQITSIPISEITKLLEAHKIKLPLYAYRFLLKETIRFDVFEENRYQSYTDELKYRLRNYDNYSIFLLEKLIDKYDLDYDLVRFKEKLLDFLYINRDNLKIGKSFFNELENLGKDFPEKTEKLSYKQFYQIFNPVLTSTVGYIDGIHSEAWTDDMLTSHTLGDLKNLGQKYNIKVPRRINKSRLVEILTTKFRLSEEEKQSLEKKSILDIEIYAKEKGFRISTDLKKKDMIEFLRYSMDIYHKDIPDDEFNYDLPIDKKTPIEIMIEEEEKAERIAKEKTEKISKEEAEKAEETKKQAKEETIVEEEIKVEEEIQEDTDIDKIEEELEEAIEDVAEEMDEDGLEEVFKEEDEETADIEIEDLEEQEPKKQEKPITDKESIPTELADSELLSEEEKELLDEKIAYIIRKYHQKKRRRKILWTFFIILFVLIVAAVVYSYVHFHYITDGELPFNIPIFWR